MTTLKTAETLYSAQPAIRSISSLAGSALSQLSPEADFLFGQALGYASSVRSVCRRGHGGKHGGAAPAEEHETPAQIYGCRLTEQVKGNRKTQIAQVTYEVTSRAKESMQPSRDVPSSAELPKP